MDTTIWAWTECVFGIAAVERAIVEDVLVDVTVDVVCDFGGRLPSRSGFQTTMNDYCGKPSRPILSIQFGRRVWPSQPYAAVDADEVSWTFAV
jgi:hypothetical protein